MSNLKIKYKLIFVIVFIFMGIFLGGIDRVEAVSCMQTRDCSGGLCNVDWVAGCMSPFVCSGATYLCMEGLNCPDQVCEDPSPPPEIYGCTDPSATNYNSSATADDGSCIYPIYGCMDSSASNYNSSATVDDGSCVYPPPPGPGPVPPAPGPVPPAPGPVPPAPGPVPPAPGPVPPPPNSPPGIPNVGGPVSGNPDVVYNYTFSSIDADNDQIKYRIDWGDGTFAWFPVVGFMNPFPASGNSTHSWAGTGIKPFRVYAEDDNGNTSGWANWPVNITNPVPTHLVVAVKSPVVGGSVTSDVPGISCGADCSETFDEGATINLTALPNSTYWQFTGWSSEPVTGSCSGSGLCTLNVSQPYTVTATFVPRSFEYREF